MAIPKSDHHHVLLAHLAEEDELSTRYDPYRCPSLPRLLQYLRIDDQSSVDERRTALQSIHNTLSGLSATHPSDDARAKEALAALETLGVPAASFVEAVTNGRTNRPLGHAQPSEPGKGQYRGH